ncbi:hypothetical protein TNCT_265121 [Trichonephila clavata]|uniref:Uncharacterized protein n=1 Tax=Trichonephila clavata TaxID=2740835 RepID=A0A8X6FF64_TRICU|nr:hypothetical protein TNCT_265121 [Trichonephila clavata]
MVRVDESATTTAIQRSGDCVFEYYVDGRSIGEYRTAEVAAPSGGHLGRCDRLGFRQAMLQRPCGEGPKIHSKNQGKKRGGGAKCFLESIVCVTLEEEMLR